MFMRVFSGLISVGMVLSMGQETETKPYHLHNAMPTYWEFLRQNGGAGQEDVLAVACFSREGKRGGRGSMNSSRRPLLLFAKFVEAPVEGPIFVTVNESDNKKS
jgi:hypothetical protein